MTSIDPDRPSKEREGADPPLPEGGAGIRWKQACSEMIRGGSSRKNVIALIDQGIVSVANFLTGLIIGRICTKEQFGLYMLGFTVITMATCVQDSLILTPYTIYSPRLKGTALARYTASTFLHQFLYSGCILFLLLVFRGALWLGFGPPGMGPVVEALIVVLGFILLRYYARKVSFAALKMGEALVLDGMVSLLQVCGLFALAYFHLLSASSAYWIVGLACAAGALPWFLSRRKDFTFRRGETFSDLRQNVSTGVWILASGLLWTAVISLYPWLLATFHGTASTGVWAACFGILAFCNPLFLAMQNSYGPKIAHAFARDGGGDLRRFSLQATKVFGAAIAPFCVVLLFFGGDLVAGIYGGKYAGNGAIVSLLALDFLFTALTFPLSRALFTVGRADIDFKINLVMLLCLLSFGIPLTRRFGPMGAAASLLITDFVCLAFRFAAFSRWVRSDTERSLLESKPVQAG